MMSLSLSTSCAPAQFRHAAKESGVSESHVNVGKLMRGYDPRRRRLFYRVELQRTSGGGPLLANVEVPAGDHACVSVSTQPGHGPVIDPLLVPRIHFVVSLRNQAERFLDFVDQVVASTGTERRMKLVVVDYSSIDASLERLLKVLGLPYTFYSFPVGIPFGRGKGLMKGTVSPSYFANLPNLSFFVICD